MEDVRFQTFVQVTDLAMYIADSISNTIVWVNSLESGSPVSGAVIEHVGTGKKHSTNKDGVALFDSFPAGTPERTMSRTIILKFPPPTEEMPYCHVINTMSGIMAIPARFLLEVFPDRQGTV